MDSRFRGNDENWIKNTFYEGSKRLNCYKKTSKEEKNANDS